MTALIVGNGEVSKAIKDRLPKNPYVICADGGIRHMELLGLEADILIGDMDSSWGEKVPERVIKYPVRKDYTDGELAVDYAIENGFSEIVMIGFIGSRADHTLTNIFLLKRIKEHGVSARMIDEHNEIYCADSLTIEGAAGDIVSIIPIDGDAECVTAEGLEYPLAGETLYFGAGRGVSNAMTGTKCRVTIGRGTALIIKSRD